MYRRIPLLKQNQRQTGTWTPTWGVGFSSDPSGDLRWQIIGANGPRGTGLVIITSDDGTSVEGTSDTTAMTITGIPTEIRPDVQVTSSLFIATDENTVGRTVAVCQVSTAGVMTFSTIDTAVASHVAVTTAGWDNANAKGLPAGFSFMYPLIILK